MRLEGRAILQADWNYLQSYRIIQAINGTGTKADIQINGTRIESETNHTYGHLILTRKQEYTTTRKGGLFSNGTGKTCQTACTREKESGACPSTTYTRKSLKQIKDLNVRSNTGNTRTIGELTL